MNDLTADRWRRLDTLLAEALARDPDARTAYLRAACGDDPGLYAEAAALLRSAEEAASALGESLAAFAAPLLADAAAEGADDLAAGALVGPYRIEGEAGRGGMGVVYRATRADGAFRKTVALKLVKRGMDTDDVLARFRRERQVLAGLDHPAIARLLDGGAAGDGRPYLVMEYVEGEPITAYADRRRLGVEARLALFEGACEAVQHAHRRLVVHRDLKPSNVLVAEGEGGAAQVKLLDFGIAKLLEEGADAATTMTGGGALTPAYAAPEQRRGEAVTTAADVYALGVVLHELLVGRRPEEPARAPGAAVTPEAAAAHGTTPGKLRRRLQGDLGTIVLKALREEPEARYPSVEALLDDLRRYRAGLPVSARPASAGYRVRRFVRRHRVGAAATALVALALVGGLGAALWQAQAKAREAARADLARSFALGLFTLADPDETQGAALTTEQLLDRGAERALEALAGEPEVQEEILMALADINERLSRYDAAGAQYEHVRAQRAARLGPDHPATAAAVSGLATVALDAGALDRADSLFRRALAVQRRHPGAAQDLARTLYSYGALARAQDDDDAAEARHREALALRIAHFGPESAEVAQSLKSLALVQHQRGAYADAEALYREALTLQVRLTGEIHPEVGTISNSLATLLRMRGAYAEADSLYRRALAVQRRLFPGDHRNLVTTLSQWSGLLTERGRPEAARAPAEEAAAMAQRLFGEAHPSTALALSALANTAYEEGRYAEAIPLQERVVAIYRAGPGPEHPYTALMQTGLARSHLERGDAATAEALFRQAAAVQEAVLEAGHPDRAPTLIGLGRALLVQGRPEEAEPLLRRALAFREAELGAGHPHTAEAQSWLGAALVAQRRPAEAEALLTASARALDREARRSIHRAVRANLAAYYAAAGRPAEAARYR